MLAADVVKQAVEFHGHMCPGLALGLRVAELALAEFGRHGPENELVAVVETDMCPVDAIQLLTGCTFGRGNLVHLDYGKNVFTFTRPADGKALRMVVRPEGWPGRESDPQALSRAILDGPLDRLLRVTPAGPNAPLRVRPLNQLTCVQCGETMLESRSRRFAGETLCIPCFAARETCSPGKLFENEGSKR
jgi:formylmethanofuran dehydrogenase subunit E